MSEIYVDKKVYPTPENYQQSGEPTLPLKWVIAYLQSIIKSLPADEADACEVRHWSSLELWTKHRRSEVEIREAQRAVLLQQLQVAIGDGTITPDELQAAIARSADA